MRFLSRSKRSVCQEEAGNKKKNTTSHRRQCLNVLRFVCTGPRWWRKRITYDRRVFIMDREKRWRKPGQSPHPLLQEPNPRRKHLINIQFVRGVHFFWVCPCPHRVRHWPSSGLLDERSPEYRVPWKDLRLLLFDVGLISDAIRLFRSTGGFTEVPDRDINITVGGCISYPSRKGGGGGEIKGM